MSKKILIILAIATAVLIPATAYAARYVELPWTNNIYNVSGREKGINSEGTVTVFDDADNKCYVATAYNGNMSNSTVAISCVKR